MRSVVANFEDMSSKSIDLITKGHLLWAELLSNFTDIKKVCWKAAAPPPPAPPAQAGEA